MKSFKKLLKQLIIEGFPELRCRIIILRFTKSKDYYMGTFGFLFLHFILIDKKVKKYPENIIIGLMAHELAHILKGGVLNTLLSGKSITEMERDTDTEVIKRGYGKHLLEFIIFHNKHYKKYKKEDGLTEKEIKGYLKK